MDQIGVNAGICWEITKKIFSYTGLPQVGISQKVFLEATVLLYSPCGVAAAQEGAAPMSGSPMFADH